MVVRRYQPLVISTLFFKKIRNQDLESENFTRTTASITKNTLDEYYGRSFFSALKNYQLFYLLYQS
jgi:hypothetical protein